MTTFLNSLKSMNIDRSTFLPGVMLGRHLLTFFSSRLSFHYLFFFEFLYLSNKKNSKISKYTSGKKIRNFKSGKKTLKFNPTINQNDY